MNRNQRGMEQLDAQAGGGMCSVGSGVAMSYGSGGPVSYRICELAS